MGMVGLVVVVLVVGGFAVFRRMTERPMFSPGTVGERIRARRETLDPPMPGAGPEDFWQVAEGIRLHVARVGVGRDVLVVHGGPGFPPAKPWRSALESAEGIRWNFYDQRGCGKSTRPIREVPGQNTWKAMQEVEATLGLAEQIADIERIRRLMGKERLTLVGHSFGALIAALYAAEWPDRVSTLVLVAPAPLATMPNPEGDLFSLVRARLDGPKRDEFDRYMKEYFDFPSLLRRNEADLAAFFGRMGTYFGAAAGEAPSASGDAGGFVSLGLYLSLGRRHDWSEWLGRVRARVFVVRGERDLQTHETTLRFSRAFTDAKLITVKDAGHFLYDERPEQFAQIMRDVMKESAE